MAPSLFTDPGEFLSDDGNSFRGLDPESDPAASDFEDGTRHRPGDLDPLTGLTAED